MNIQLLSLKKEIVHLLNSLEIELKQDYSKIPNESIKLLNEKLYQYNRIYNSLHQLTTEDKIFYVKHIKCFILANLKYYKYIRKIEFNKPPSTFKELKKYYLKVLFQIKQKIAKSSDFQEYYLINEKHVDLLFFANDQITTNTENYYANNLSNYFINNYAKLCALHMLRSELKKKIKLFTNIKEHQNNTISSKIIWTASKTDLIELIYALHAAGVFNNGQAAIKDIIEAFQLHFKADLAQHSRIFHDIKLRKSNKTKHIDLLKEKLLTKIKDTDYKLFIE